jgi:hypothetical protein
LLFRALSRDREICEMMVRCKELRAIRRNIGALVSISAACVLLSGCGNGLAQVSGQVTLDGQPVRGGRDGARVTVQFQPASGQGATAVALADENGNYEMATGSQTGISPGEYLVTCSATEVLTSSNTGIPSFRQLADPKYAKAQTSGLKFTVESGKNEFDIPLESPRGPTTARQN